MKNIKGNTRTSWETSQLFLNFMAWNRRSLTKKIQQLCEKHTGNSIKESAKLGFFLTLYLHSSKLWQKVAALSYVKIAY